MFFYNIEPALCGRFLGRAEGGASFCDANSKMVNIVAELMT